VQTIRSITAREIFKACPEVKKRLWGGEFWSDGYFIATVGQHGNEEVMKKYIQPQGATEKYKPLHKKPPKENGQLRLF
jgi:putative transposase